MYNLAAFLGSASVIITHFLRHLLAMVQLLGLDMLAEQISSEEVDQLPEPPCCMDVRRHAKHLIELLQSLLLGLGHEKQHEEKSDQVPSCIPAKGSRRRKG
jgi:hypothetical protein